MTEISTGALFKDCPTVLPNTVLQYYISVSFTVQECNNVTTPLLSNFCSVVCQMVAYERLKTFSSKSGHGRLREVVAYKRFQI